MVHVFLWYCCQWTKTREWDVCIQFNSLLSSGWTNVNKKNQKRGESERNYESTARDKTLWPDKWIRIVKITRTALMLEKLKTKTVFSDDSDKKWGFQA